MAKLIISDNMIVASPVSTPILLPVSSIDGSLWEFQVIADGTNRWREWTGKHTLTVVGTPTLITNQLGFQGTKDNYLLTSFTEATTWGANQDFTAITIGRFFQDNVYASGHLMGAISGADGVDYRGFSMGFNQNTSPVECRDFMQLSYKGVGSTNEQRIFYTNAKAGADSARFRLQVMRVTHASKEMAVFDFAGYNGTSALSPTLGPFSGTDALTGRLQGNTSVALGTFNGYTGGEQVQFVMGALYKGALTNAQIKDLANYIRDQFRSNTTINGTTTLGGISAKAGMTSFDLFAAALT